MTALVVSVLVAGLLGSVHCAAMCGSFACLASGNAGSPRMTALGSSASYNVGRLFSYALLGAIVGAAGAGLDRAADVAGFARPAAVAAGLLLMLWGSATVLAALGLRVPSLDVPPALASLIARGMRAVQSQPPLARAFGIGALSAALPCGWLYAYVATSAAAGSAVGGAVVMAAFWLGTLPMMATVGIAAHRVLGRFRTRLPLVSATVLIVLGALTMAGRVVPATISSSDEVVNGQHDHR